MEYQFKGLLFPVFDVGPQVNLVAKFPTLGMFPEFSTFDRPNKNMYIRYVVAAYDPHGMIVFEQNLPKRKAKAAELAGFKRNQKGEFLNDVNRMMSGEDKQVNAMIIRYCRFIRDTEYSALVAMAEVYYRSLAKMVNGEELKTAEYAQFEKYETGIPDRMVKFVTGDPSKRLRDSLYEFIELEPLELRPEDIARKLAEGLMPVDIKPYGDWKPSTLTIKDPDANEEE